MNIIMLDKNEIFGKELEEYLRIHGISNTVTVFNTMRNSISYFAKHPYGIDLILFNFEIIDFELQCFMDSIPGGCSVIGIASSKNDINSFINYPHVQRIFINPISTYTIFDYLIKYNSHLIQDNTKIIISQILNELGFSANHSGTTYILEGSMFARKNKISRLSDIYTFVAFNYNTEPRLVGWSVNNAINHAIRTGNEKKIQSFFKITDNQRLTAKFIINYFMNTSILSL